MNIQNIYLTKENGFIAFLGKKLQFLYLFIFFKNIAI